jgi:hypothetical protein
MHFNLIVTYIPYYAEQNLCHKEWQPYASRVSNNHNDCNMNDSCVI